MKLHEERTVSLMVSMYCRKKHGLDDTLCSSCRSLLDYATEKLVHCPLRPDKPVCSNCRIHCYLPPQRKAMREVMRFSGPRIVLRHPFIGMAYLFKKFSTRNIESNTKPA